MNTECKLESKNWGGLRARLAKTAEQTGIDCVEYFMSYGTRAVYLLPSSVKSMIVFRSPSPACVAALTSMVYGT